MPPLAKPQSSRAAASSVAEPALMTVAMIVRPSRSAAAMNVLRARVVKPFLTPIAPSYPCRIRRLPV